jgi:hypothetical protein
MLERRVHAFPTPHPPSHIRRGHRLALQATLLVEPAHKHQPLVFRSGLVIGPLLIERFDSEDTSDLLARKIHVLELPNLRQSGKLLSEFHGHPPVSLRQGRGLYDCQRPLSPLKYVYLAIQS